MFERGLADRFLEIYLPIRASGSSDVIGAYEIYEDAAPIEAHIASTRRDVLVIVGAMAIGLLPLLFAAFSGALDYWPGRTVSFVEARSASGRWSRTPPT